MSIQPQDTELKECFALFGKGEDEKAKLETMMDKVHEEVCELQGAIIEYVSGPEYGTSHGKAREHLLEEAVDAQTALQTLMRVVASRQEIKNEILKTNIKNELRGYHGEDPEDD